MDDAFYFACPHGECTAAQDAEHPRILGEHVGLKPRDSVGARDVCKFLEQAACDSAALKVLFHREGDVGGCADAHVAAEPDDGFLIAAPHRGHQHGFAYAVASGDPPQLLLAELQKAAQAAARAAAGETTVTGTG